MQTAGLFQGKSHLALFKRGMLRTEGDNDPFNAISLGFAFALQPAGCPKRFKSRKLDPLAAFGSDATD